MAANRQVAHGLLHPETSHVRLPQQDGQRMKPPATLPPRSCQAAAFLGCAALVAAALLYCAAALAAPFWGNNDCWSNLLPIIHYRISILEQHTFPAYTSLWYGGWPQWQNPLWSFPYLPATLAWLVLPLAWGMRVVMTGHLVFALLAGRSLASHFVKGEGGRVAAAIILVSPMLPGLLAGHVEKVMAWGWLLLAFYVLSDKKRRPWQRGLGAGLCWGVMALTGANYHTLYAGALLVPLAFSLRREVSLAAFGGGATLGLLHLPGVWRLLGVSRVFTSETIATWSTDLAGLFTSMTVGLAKPLGWESWALVGLPVVYLFLRVVFLAVRDSLVKRRLAFSPQQGALLGSIVILCLMATGILYRGHLLLDSFRVAVRALPVAAAAVALFVLVSNRTNTTRGYAWLLAASALQVGLMSWTIRPPGATHSPSDPEIQQLAGVLLADGAESVWFSMNEMDEMVIPVALTERSLALPNVYYGDIGQAITMEGPYCGYSFSHLVTHAAGEQVSIELTADVQPHVVGTVPLTELQPIGQVTVYSQPYAVYRVLCEPGE
ncbi:MAG: hypothetical protein FJZ96_02510 [Chloroflexi bacterium]|nr:hypothetical protein [Chloroflexota bacterium]